jgi:hypothetical protein
MPLIVSRLPIIEAVSRAYCIEGEVRITSHQVIVSLLIKRLTSWNGHSVAAKKVLLIVVLEVFVTHVAHQVASELRFICCRSSKLRIALLLLVDGVNHVT